MSAEFPWLEEMVGVVRCAACGVPYAREDLRVVGRRDEHWFLRCTCGACHRQGIAVVSVHELHAPRVQTFGPSRPPLTEDDVLNAHEILRDHAGNMDALLGPRATRVR